MLLNFFSFILFTLLQEFLISSSPDENMFSLLITPNNFKNSLMGRC